MELDQSLFRDLESALADCGLSDQGLQFCLPAGLMLVQLGFITWHWSNFHFLKKVFRNNSGSVSSRIVTNYRVHFVPGKTNTTPTCDDMNNSV